MLANAIVHLVDLSRRHARAVAALALLLACGCGWYAATHFKINTDINQLLADDLPWRQQEAAMGRAFPQKLDNLVIVIDGAAPGAAENAAAALAEKLRAMPQLVTNVERPDAIPFFRKNGLLFLSKDELQGTLTQMMQAQPLLGTLAADPSLRGFAGMLDLMAKGLQGGQVDYAQLDKPFAAIADSAEAALAGHDKPLALQSMMGDGNVSPRDARKFIIAKPVLDFSALQSGAAATDAVRMAAKELGLTTANGIRVRLTGPVALNDEEFASVADGAGTATALSAILVFTLLLLALRSLRIVLPIVLTLVTGLLATSAFAVAAVGSLNMISVAFAVMFIGIAVDFGIQFGVRYRDQHHEEPDHALAMVRTVKLIALPLSMAAASTALGFLAFIPTAYRGVSELGLIAGAGMVIAFFLNVTLLPALMTLTRPPAESEAVGYLWAAPADAFIIRHRRGILLAALLLAIAGLAVASQLVFDFDPLNLKNPQTESVTTMFDVMQDPDSDAYAAETLRPSLAEAQALAANAEKLPEVSHAMTLASFVPEDQAEKLAMIAQARDLLLPALSLPQSPAPNDAENLGALHQLATDLHRIGDGHPSAARLAAALDQIIARGDAKLVGQLQADLILPAQGYIQQVQTLLSAEPITPETIGTELRRDWVTADGRYRVEIYPKGNPRDHETLVAFAKAVRGIAPDVTGAAISIQESAKTISSAFLQAGVYALIAIALLAFLVLRRVMDVLFMLAPLLLAGILTLATIVLIGLPLNFANIIALPLLLSLGVSYAIYFVSYARSGQRQPLQSSMARAVLFSAATVLVAFGSLALSSHPGTAGMGKLLTVALLYSLSCTIFILPALLAPPKQVKS